MKMALVGMRALQKVLQHSHMPSLAAGKPNHITIVVGDWNVPFATFQDCVVDAKDDERAQTVGSTSLCAARTDQRDMAVVFSGGRHTVAEIDDDISPAIYKALDDCIGGDHEVLFFHVTVASEPSQPARSNAPASPRDAIKVEIEHLVDVFGNMGIHPELLPVPFPWAICGLKLADGCLGEVYFCFFMLV